MAQSLLLKTLKSLLLELRSAPSAGRLPHPKAAAHPSHAVVRFEQSEQMTFSYRLGESET